MSRAVSAGAVALLGVWALVFILHGDTGLAPFELALLVPSLVLLVLLPAKAEPPRSPTILACALRAPLGAVVFAAGALVRIDLAGGVPHADRWEVVLALAVFGLALGPLAVFEHGPGLGTTRRAAILVAAVAGWTAAVLLALAWVQARYVRTILDGQGAAAALASVNQDVSMLMRDPGSTLRHVLVVLVPVAAAVWPRLRGWAIARQAALVLVGSAASFSLLQWSATDWSPGEPTEAVGLTGLGIALPLVFAGSDRLARRLGAEESSEPSRRAPFWVAVVLAIVAALVLLAREAHRQQRRATLASGVQVQLAKWLGNDTTAPCAALTARVDLLERQCDADPSVETGERVWPELLELEKKAGALAISTRALYREVNEVVVEFQDNGGDVRELQPGWGRFWTVFRPITEVERRIRVLKKRVVGMRFPSRRDR